ncbi:hypothetical protein KCP74_13825 [Salmonella enterica subsp. enterica]|nr:hypothetical protein KCP74_13825 [Salmonella enterica subsp. enterica]
MGALFVRKSRSTCGITAIAVEPPYSSATDGPGILGRHSVGHPPRGMRLSAPPFRRKVVQYRISPV